MGENSRVRVVIADPPSYTPPYDDALASALARRGHAVDLLASPFLFGTLPEPDGYRRHDVFWPLGTRLLGRNPRSRARLLVKALDYVPSVRRLLRTTDELDPDVVHVQWLVRPDLDLRWLRALAAKRPTVFTAHDPAGMLAGRRDAWLEVFRTVESVVVHSHRAVEELSEVGLERERITRIAHPVFAAPDDHASGPPRGHVLLFFGLIRSYKGLDLLIRALELVSREVPDVRLVVAGDPLDPVEPLRELAAELGISERIEWRLRYVSESEIREALASAAAVVLPYRRRVDASGVLGRALGRGRPAVVSDVGALGETVGEFGAGIVVPPEDVPALAHACVRLLTDEAARASAFEGTRAARAALTWDAAAEAHERLYEEVAAARGRRTLL